jgi:hypothetical protein
MGAWEGAETIFSCSCPTCSKHVLSDKRHTPVKPFLNDFRNDLGSMLNGLCSFCWMKGAGGAMDPTMLFFFYNFPHILLFSSNSL